MMRPTHGRRTGLQVCAAAALLLIGGCSAGGGGVDPDPAPSASPSPGTISAPQGESPTGQEPNQSPTQPETPSDRPSPEASPEDETTAMPASEPATVAVPAIGVESDVMELGLQDDGLIEVPPYNYGSPAGWYVHSPTPGEVGPSVILGHRNGLEGGPGIFAGLPQVEVGDSVEVTRADGSLASFTIYRVELFDKGEAFPTLEVYGNTAGPEIRLITCDGLNAETGMLEDNFIAYGELDT